MPLSAIIVERLTFCFSSQNARPVGPQTSLGSLSSLASVIESLEACSDQLGAMLKDIDDPADVFALVSKKAELPLLVSRLSDVATGINCHELRISDIHDSLSKMGGAPVGTALEWTDVWMAFREFFPKTNELAPAQLAMVEKTIRDANAEGVLVLLFSLEADKAQANTELLATMEQGSRQASLRFVLKLLNIPMD